jgi:hypothetical protein
MSDIECKSIDSLEKCCETNHCNPYGFNRNDLSIKRCQRLGKSKKHKACKTTQHPRPPPSQQQQHPTPPPQHEEEEDQPQPSSTASDGLFGPVLNRVNGIHMLSLFTDLPNNRKILLLGEYHDEGGSCKDCDIDKFCLDVDNYIYSLVGEKKECIDFFIEHAINLNQRSGGPQRQQTISKSRDFWERLRPRLGRNHPYLRLHYWDTRQLMDVTPNPQFHPLCQLDNVPISSHMRIMLISLIKDNKIDNIYDLVDMFYRYFILPDEEIDTKTKDIIETFLNIYNFEITKGTDLHLVKYVKTKIIKQYNKCPILKERSLQDIIQILVKAFMKTTFGFVSSSSPTNMVNRIIQNSFYFGTIITDTYLLFRIFSNWGKQERTPQGCDLMYAKNAIVYGGALHTRHLRNILIELFHHPLYDYDGRDECIELGENKQFF